ncbi:DUF3352 domain-containing protein, partial [bacterium]|nr:DUF3352 domain-containing protein [bacterium]
MTIKTALMLSFFTLVLVISGCSDKSEPVAIPDNAFLYFQAEDIEGNWDQLKTRQFFAKSSQWQIWDEPWMKEVLKPLKDLQIDFQKNTGLPLNETTVMMVFGKKIDIAVIPAQPLPAILLIADLGSKSAPLKMITKALENIEPERVSHYEYLKHDITAIKTQNPELSEALSMPETLICFHKDRIIVSTSRSCIQNALDIIEDKAPPLSQNKDYQFMQESIGPTSATLYVKPLEMMNQIVTSGQQFGADTQSVPIYVTALISGINVTESGLEFSSAFLPGNTEENIFETLYSKGDSVKKAAKWLPSECIAGIAGGINLPGMIRHQKSILSEINTPDDVELWTTLTSALQTSTGLDIPLELETWGGDGAFFCIENIRMVTFVPVPDLAFGINVRDKKTAKAFTDSLRHQILSNYGAAIEEMVDVTLPDDNIYTYAPIPMLAGFQPGYALVDDYLIFGSSVSTVTNLITSQQGNTPRLFDSARFSHLLKSEKNKLVLCKAFDPQRFVTAGNNALDSLSLFLVAADQKPVVYREILDTMNSIPGIGFRMQVSDDLILY